MKTNLRAIDLNLLTVFDALMTDGQASRAANRIGMSQPAMSAALQRLRLTFDDPLFVRTREGLLPTPRAREIHERVRQALALVQDALASTDAFDPASTTRTFNVQAGTHFEMEILGPLLRTLTQQGPALSVRMTDLPATELATALRHLMLDLLIDYQLLDDPDIARMTLAEERLVVIAHKHHPRIGKTLSLSRYLAEPHVILPPRHAGRTQLEQALGGQPMGRKIAAQVQHFSAMPPVVATTDCLATLPSRLAAVYARLFPIRLLRFPGGAPSIPLWAMWPAALSQDAGHRWFREQLHTVLTRSPFGDTPSST